MKKVHNKDLALGEIGIFFIAKEWDVSVSNELCILEDILAMKKAMEESQGCLSLSPLLQARIDELAS